LADRYTNPPPTLIGGTMNRPTTFRVTRL
jgi:hypothetical protein